MAPEALTEKDLDLLIEEVEQDFKKMATEAEANLKKSEKDEKAAKAEMCKEEEKKPEELATAEASLDAQAAMPAEEQAPAEEAPEAAEAAPEAPAESAPAEEAPSAELVDEAAQMPEQSWEELLAQLPEEELAQIHDALVAVSQKKWEDEAAAGGEMQKEEMPSDPNGKLKGMKKEEPAAEAKEEEKKEEDKKEEKAEKSEKDDYLKQLKDLENAVEGLVKSMASKVPARKTAVEVIAKGEVEGGEKLEKSDDEVYKEVRQLVKTVQLSKSEQDAVTAYFDDRSKSGPVRKILETKSK